MTTANDKVAPDKVAPLPTLFERLGRRIDQAWDRIRQGEYQWVEGSLELAQALADARGRYESDNEFGTWLKENKHDHVNHQDRAALIGLASDIALARTVLTETTQRSYQHIWAKVKDRFTQVSKPDKPKRRRGSGGNKKTKPRGEAAKYAKAREIIRPRIEADQPIKTAELEKQHGISKDTFERAALAEQAAREAVVEARQIAFEDQWLDNAKFSDKGRATIADAIRIHKTRLDKQFEQRVNGEVRRRIDAADDATRANNKKLHLENITLQRIVGERGVFTEIQFKQMLLLCHPDSSASPQTKAELLQVLVDNKIKLVKPSAAGHKW